MVLEAAYLRDGEEFPVTSTAAHSSGEVLQTPDGRPGHLNQLEASASGDAVALKLCGVSTYQKTTSQVYVAGQRLFWDTSANKVSYAALAAGDYYLGTAAFDATAAATTCAVNTDVVTRPIASVSASVTRTGVTIQEVGAAGAPRAVLCGGGALQLKMDATSEVQAVSALSDVGVAVSSNWFGYYRIKVTDNGTSAVDINIGVANDDHGTDADSITESVFIHIDGGSLNILAESDDGTTEVAATDTTVDYVVGTEFHLIIDGRDPAGVLIYINGVRVLSGSTFVLTDATGPMKLLAMMEKSTGTATGGVQVFGELYSQNF